MKIHITGSVAQILAGTALDPSHRSAVLERAARLAAEAARDALLAQAGGAAGDASSVRLVQVRGLPGAVGPADALRVVYALHHLPSTVGPTLGELHRAALVSNVSLSPQGQGSPAGRPAACPASRGGAGGRAGARTLVGGGAGRGVSAGSAARSAALAVFRAAQESP